MIKNLHAFRVLALLCLLISAHRAAYGFFAYRAERAHALNNYQKTYLLSQMGLKLDAQNLELLYRKTQSAWMLYKTSGHPEPLSLSREASETLIRLYPFWGRGWIYNALTHLEKEDRSRNWEKYAPRIEKGVSLEPGNAWVLNTAAQLMLRSWSLLSEQEKEKALERLRRSLSMTDSNQASAYLGSSVELLWNAEKDFERILKIVPKTVYVYDELLRFALKKKLWEFRPALFAEAQQLRREAYARQIAKGDALLKKGLKQRAFFEYQQASWLDNTRVYAEAGMIASGYPRKWWPFRLENALEVILKDREEQWDFLLPRLKPVLEDLNNPALDAAYESKEKKEPAVFLPKIQKFGPDLWWHKTRGNTFALSGDSAVGMPLALNAGKNMITIEMRNAGDEKGYVRAVLSSENRSKPLGEALVPSAAMAAFPFEVSVPGGKYWLQVELVNGTETGGPQLELGNVLAEKLS